MNEEKTKGLDWPRKLVTTLLSVVAVFATYYWHILTSTVLFSVILALLSVLGIISYKFKEKKRLCKVLFPSVLVAIIALVVARYFIDNGTKILKENEIISDATESIVQDRLYVDSDKPWLEKAFYEDKLVCLLVESDIENKEFIDAVFDKREIDSYFKDVEDFDYMVSWQKMQRYKKEIKCRYDLVLAYSPHLNKNISHKKITILPESVLMVVKGMDLIQKRNVEEGSALLKRAAAMGNPAADYYIYYMYKYAWGIEPSDSNDKKAEKSLRKAAEKGSRSARFILGERLITKEDRTQLELGTAIDYLTAASLLRTMASTYLLTKATDAVYYMSNYYYAHGLGKKAYSLTSAFLKYYDDPDFRFTFRLFCCLNNKYYDEAKEIITMGERKEYRHPYCYIIHAQMFINGELGQPDYNKAESLFRFAADSLDYLDAYEGLAKLYRLENREGADFYEGLYNVGFESRVK